MRRDAIGWLILLWAIGSARRSSSAPRPNRIPEGPPTEDNWIPPQPTLPPNPLDPNQGKAP